ncbi:hypothetical protein B0H11DRAFT_2034055 [Mycena galericulata]|nr:hypothetical protein B0H11DRAFT_2034055 [Mycena galericulata]
MLLYSFSSVFNVPGSSLYVHPPTKMGMFGRFRKRPRKPGGLDLGSSITPRPPTKSRIRNYFRVSKKTPVTPQEVSESDTSVPSDAGPKRRSRSGLDAFVAKILLAASDAPVVSIVKPFAGLFDLSCQTALVVGSNEEALADLERYAEHVGDVLARGIFNITPSLRRL